MAWEHIYYSAEFGKSTSCRDLSFLLMTDLFRYAVYDSRTEGPLNILITLFSSSVTMSEVTTSKLFCQQRGSNVQTLDLLKEYASNALLLTDKEVVATK